MIYSLTSQTHFTKREVSLSCALKWFRCIPVISWFHISYVWLRYLPCPTGNSVGWHSANVHHQTGGTILHELFSLLVRLPFLSYIRKILLFVKFCYTVDPRLSGYNETRPWPDKRNTRICVNHHANRVYSVSLSTCHCPYGLLRLGGGFELQTIRLPTRLEKSKSQIPYCTPSPHAVFTLFF